MSFSLKCYLSFNPYLEHTTELYEQHCPMTGNLTGRLAQFVERRTREHNVSGLYRLWVRVPGWPTKILNCLSDETLSRGPV